MKPVFVKTKRFPDTGIWVRKGTTDEKVVEEVMERNVYQKPSIGFLIEESDVWLDLGGNIGTFAILCLLKGAKVISYEPEPENVQLLKKNLDRSSFRGRYTIVPKAVVPNKTPNKTKLYLAKNPKNKYRHSLVPIRGRKSIDISSDSLDSVLSKYCPNAIKMDIEGSEIALLESFSPSDWKRHGIKKLVFEYSFDVDPSISRFLKIMDQLQKYFKTVQYSKVKADESEYKYFPAATLVFCIF